MERSTGWCLWLRISTTTSGGKVKLLDVTSTVLNAAGDPTTPEAAAADQWLQASRGRSQRGVCNFTKSEELGCRPWQRQGSWALEVPAIWPLAAAFCLKRCAACDRCNHLSISLSNAECNWFSECARVQYVLRQDWRSAPALAR